MPGEPSPAVTRRRRRYAARELIDGRLVARAVPPDAHGASCYVNHGCRCPVCTKAASERSQRHKATRCRCPACTAARKLAAWQTHLTTKER